MSGGLERARARKVRACVHALNNFHIFFSTCIVSPYIGKTRSVEKSWRRKQETPKNGQMATVWVKMSERVKRKRSQKLLGHAHYGRPSKNFFAHARGVSGACPVRLFEKLEKVFLAKLGHQSRKRAERGWKSEAGPLSWKSGWKPSISRWFWAIGGYCIFFPFRDMAILKCPLGRIKFPMLKYGPVECLIWGMFQWAKQAFIGTVCTTRGGPITGNPSQISDNLGPLSGNFGQYQAISARYQVIQATHKTIPSIYQAIPAKYQVIPDKYQAT